jgi:hypothetical protein
VDQPPAATLGSTTSSVGSLSGAIPFDESASAARSITRKPSSKPACTLTVASSFPSDTYSFLPLMRTRCGSTLISISSALNPGIWARRVNCSSDSSISTRTGQSNSDSAHNQSSISSPGALANHWVLLRAPLSLEVSDEVTSQSSIRQKHEVHEGSNSSYSVVLRYQWYVFLSTHCSPQ